MSKFDEEYFDRRQHDVETIAKVPDAAAPHVVTTNLTKTQLEVFGSQRVATCGGCKYFRHGAAQQEMKDQDFMRVLLYEYEWKAKHLCDDHKNLAICDQHGDMLVGPMTKGCEYWNPK